MLHFALHLPDNWYAEHLEQTDTTMRQLRQPRWQQLPREFALLTTDFQTAGHGQKGTVWEAEKGQNLLFGMVFHPTFLPANRQFALSEASALAVAGAASELTADICVKWPNDIYWQQRKLGGMLLEHDLCGPHIANTISGVGLNVNQTVFRSDAPNPVSLRQIVGHTVDREALLTEILQRFEHHYRALQQGGAEALHAEYMRQLFRAEGYHPYRDAEGCFMARIENISPQGIIRLQRNDGSMSSYAFKEVAFLPEP